MRTFAGIALLALAACGGEEAVTPEQSGLPARLIHQGEGFRIELWNENYTWNSERSARSLSAEVRLFIDEDLPAEQRPTMLYGRLFLDVDISGEWSDLDGGTAGILDDSLREARVVRMNAGLDQRRGARGAVGGTLDRTWGRGGTPLNQPGVTVTLLTLGDSRRGIPRAALDAV